MDRLLTHLTTTKPIFISLFSRSEQTNTFHTRKYPQQQVVDRRLRERWPMLELNDISLEISGEWNGPDMDRLKLSEEKWFYLCLVHILLSNSHLHLAFYGQIHWQHWRIDRSISMSWSNRCIFKQNICSGRDDNLEPSNCSVKTKHFFSVIKTTYLFSRFIGHVGASAWTGAMHSNAYSNRCH